MDSRSTLVMTVLGAADPIPIARQFIGPVVVIDKAVGEDLSMSPISLDCARKEVGWTWKPNAFPAMRRIAAEESFIFVTLVGFSAFGSSNFFLRSEVNFKM